MAPARLSRIPASSIRSEPTGELPLLQPLVAPLNEAALRALLNLPLRQDLTKLKQHQQTTNTKIPDVVETITLLLQAQKERVEDRTARRKEKGEGPVEEDEEELRQLTEKVHDLSAQLEEGMRRGIDSQAKLEARESALKFAIEAARQQRSDRAANTSATQSTLGASQFRRQGTVDSDAEDGNEGTQAPPENAMLLLRRKEEELENEYNSSSMRHRYASHNAYIEFKDRRHFASYTAGTAPVLPHANTWFREQDANDQGDNEGDGSNPDAEGPGEDEDDSGSDVEAISERINIKCPITLLPMQNPVASKKCPHKFEKEAIYTMIQNHRPAGTHPRRDIPIEQKTIQCPECHVMLTTADLVPDHVLKRNITRILAAERAKEREEDSDEDEMDGIVRGGRTNVEELSSQIGNDDAPAATRLKRERSSRLSQPGGQSSMESDDE